MSHHKHHFSFHKLTHAASHLGKSVAHAINQASHAVHVVESKAAHLIALPSNALLREADHLLKIAAPKLEHVIKPGIEFTKAANNVAASAIVHVVAAPLDKYVVAAQLAANTLQAATGGFKSVESFLVHAGEQAVVAAAAERAGLQSKSLLADELHDVTGTLKEGSLLEKGVGFLEKKVASLAKSEVDHLGKLGEKAIDGSMNLRPDVVQSVDDLVGTAEKTALATLEPVVKQMIDIATPALRADLPAAIGKMVGDAIPGLVLDPVKSFLAKDIAGPTATAIIGTTNAPTDLEKELTSLQSAVAQDITSFFETTGLNAHAVLTEAVSGFAHTAVTSWLTTHLGVLPADPRTVHTI
jgi:hypothetical protein